MWNDALAFCRQSDKLPKNSDLQKIFIAEAKGGKRFAPPRFKKRSSEQSARFNVNSFSIKRGKVYLAKIGTLKVRWSRRLPSEPSSVTVIKDAANRYFPKEHPQNGHSVGIDLGITTFATLSTGEKVESPKPLKRRLKKLARAQKKLSRCQKGSKRRERAKLRVAKIHAKVRDCRKDFLHKLSSRLIRENQALCLEDLKVSGMVQNRRLSRAISDLGWREFRLMLEAKSLMYGRELSVIDRWEPTSQKCSECGFRGGKKELGVREWQCFKCGALHDRDINAAINILVAGGQSDTLNGRGRGSKSTASGHSLNEPSIHLESEIQSCSA